MSHPIDQTQPSTEPTLEDVIEPREQSTPDHREHAKTPKHLNEGELEHRVETEREELQQDRQ